MKVERLGDIAKGVKGKKPPNLSSEITADCSIPYVDIKGFEKRKIDNYTDGIKCTFCDSDDPLIVWDGARCGLVGRGVQGAIGSTLAKIESSDLVKSYLFYFLQSIYRKVNTNPKGVGIPHIDPNILWDSPVAVPSPAEQNRIVAKIEELFSELENAITTLKITQQQLQTYRHSVLLTITSGLLTNKKCKLGNSIIIGEPKHSFLPTGWEWTFIANVARYESGHTPRKTTRDYWDGGTIPWISLQDIRAAHGTVITKTKSCITEEGVKNSSARKLPKGTVCFSRDISVGYVTIMGAEMTTTQHFANWVCSHKLSSKYLLYCFMASKEGLISEGQGTTVKTIYKEELLKMKILLPPIHVQNQLVSEIETRLSESDYLLQTINQQLIQAESLRQSILQKAFSGQI